MILDRLDRASRYEGLPEALGRALEFLATMPPDLTRGRHDIGEGDALYALVSDYTTRPVADLRWEAHHRYFDVQYVARGQERFGYGSESQFLLGAYDDVKDTQWLDPRLDGGALQFLTLEAGEFVVLWPGEAHLPGAAVVEPAPVRKIVVKVRAEGL